MINVDDLDITEATMYAVCDANEYGVIKGDNGFEAECPNCNSVWHFNCDMEKKRFLAVCLKCHIVSKIGLDKHCGGLY